MRLREPGTSWWAYHREALGGLLLGTALVAGVFTAIVAYHIPAGPSSNLTGVVTGFRLKDPRLDRRTMYVRTTTRSYTVQVSYGADCRVGDQFTLTETPHWWGGTTTTGAGLRCRRPTPLSLQ